MSRHNEQKNTAPPVYRPVNTSARTLQPKVHSWAPARYHQMPPVIRSSMAMSRIVAIQRMPLRRLGGGVLQMTPATTLERNQIEHYIDTNAARIPLFFTAQGLKEYFTGLVDEIGFGEVWTALNGVLGPPDPRVHMPVGIPIPTQNLVPMRVPVKQPTPQPVPTNGSNSNGSISQVPLPRPATGGKKKFVKFTGDLGFKTAAPPSQQTLPPLSLYSGLSKNADQLARVIEEERKAYQSNSFIGRQRHKGSTVGEKGRLINFGHNTTYEQAVLNEVGRWWSGRSSVYEYVPPGTKDYNDTHDVANFLFHHPPGQSFNFHGQKNRG
jgi:hypothetical protein